MKQLRLLREGETVSYFRDGHTNNYANVLRLLGTARFPLAQLARMIDQLKAKGYEAEIINKPTGGTPRRRTRVVEITERQAIEPNSTIDQIKGVLTTPGSGRKWVVNCVDAQLIPMDRARFIGISKGQPYWIHLDQSVTDNDKMYASVFGEGPRPFRWVFDLKTRLALKEARS